MIKLNLLGEVRSVNKSTKLQIGSFLGSLLVLFLIFSQLLSMNATEHEDLARQKATLDADIARLSKVTSEVKALEKKKNELEAKLVVIAKLKKSKAGPVRVLDDLNLAVPEKAWIKDVKESDKMLKIVGMALDNQTIALFMKNLEASNYFVNIELVETRQASYQDVNIKEFTVEAKIAYAGKNLEQPAPEAQPGSDAKRS